MRAQTMLNRVIVRIMTADKPLNDPETPMAKKTNTFDFEEALENLEELVEAMEEGELSLEESLKAFEQGIKLTRECQAALEKAEQKVQLLVKEGDSPESEDFDAELE